jgi:predicted HicB family RNase H-like nuclease
VNIADRYTYRVTWSDEDEEFVGLCAEFPSLSHLDPDRGAALQGIAELVQDVVEDLQERGEPVPEPLVDRRYTGQLRVRMPPELHRRLATEAAEDKTSLNNVIVRRLSAAR